MNVVFLIPVYNAGKVLPSTFSFYYRLNPQPSKYIFLENNSTDDTVEKIKRFKRPYELIRARFAKDAVKRLGNPYATIAIARQILLTKTRYLNPDFAIYLDHDMFIKSRDLITRLTEWNEDIVGGMYLRIYPESIQIVNDQTIITPLIASKWDDAKEGGKYELRTHPPKSFLDYGEVAMTSGGCLCLSRKIIQDRRINFYPLPTELDPMASEDYGYCLTARRFGYRVYLDASVDIHHHWDSNRKKPWAAKPGRWNETVREYEDFTF